MTEQFNTGLVTVDGTVDVTGSVFTSSPSPFAEDATQIKCAVWNASNNNTTTGLTVAAGKWVTVIGWSMTGKGSAAPSTLNLQVNGETIAYWYGEANTQSTMTAVLPGGYKTTILTEGQIVRSVASLTSGYVGITIWYVERDAV